MLRYCVKGTISVKTCKTARANKSRNASMQGTFSERTAAGLEVIRSSNIASYSNVEVHLPYAAEQRSALLHGAALYPLHSHNVNCRSISFELFAKYES